MANSTADIVVLDPTHCSQVRVASHHYAQDLVCEKALTGIEVGIGDGEKAVGLLSTVISLADFCHGMRLASRASSTLYGNEPKMFELKREARSPCDRLELLRALDGSPGQSQGKCIRATSALFKCWSLKIKI